MNREAQLRNLIAADKSALERAKARGDEWAVEDHAAHIERNTANLEKLIEYKSTLPVSVLRGKK